MICVMVVECLYQDLKNNLKQYVKGVACDKCYKTTSDKQKERYKSRQKQVELAKAEMNKS